MTGNYDDIPYPPDYGAPHAMTDTPTPAHALDLDALDWAGLKPVEFDALMVIARETASLRTQLSAATARADKAEAERDEAQRQRAVAMKFLRDRPTAPHPVDQMNNLTKFLHEDAEAEVAELTAKIAALSTELEAVKADRDAWKALADEWQAQTGQSRPASVSDDALMKINQALGEALDGATKNAKIHEDHSRRLLIKGAEARQSFEAQLSDLRALIEKAVEALGPILSFVEDLDASALSLTEQEMRPKFIRRARETLADLTAAIGKGNGT